jgi:RNA polymerase sigma factor (sigma-70 family)
MGVAGVGARELEDVYRQRYDAFVRVAGAIAGDADVGHDAVQEAFASLLRGRAGFRREAPVEAWAWRAVINAARRARGRRLHTGDAPPEAGSLNGDAAEHAVVRRWIAVLPERQRLAIFLRYFADLDYRSIAEALEVEVGTVSATLSSAHAALRKQLEVTR